MQMTLYLHNRLFIHSYQQQTLLMEGTCMYIERESNFNIVHLELLYLGLVLFLHHFQVHS